MNRPTESTSHGVSPETTGLVRRMRLATLLSSVVMAACVTANPLASRAQRELRLPTTQAASPSPPAPCSVCPVCALPETNNPLKKPPVFPYGISREAVQKALPAFVTIDLKPGESNEEAFRRLLIKLAAQIVNTLRVPPKHYQGAVAAVLRALEIFSDFGAKACRSKGSTIRIVFPPSGGQQITFALGTKLSNLAADQIQYDLSQWDRRQQLGE